MKICLLGIYDPQYPRNSFVKKGLSTFAEVVECRVDARQTGIKKYIKLIQLVRNLKQQHSFGMVWVAFPGQTVALLARMLFSCPIVLDAFTSLYDSNVCDRKLYSRMSLCGVRDYLLDFIAVHSAHTIVTDTQEHAKFFIQNFNIAEYKVTPLYVGTDIEVFDPNKYGQIITNHTTEQPIRIHFHGSYIPLQGIDIIIKALAELKDVPIVCTCIGRGSSKESMIQLAHNLGVESIQFIDRVPYSELPMYIAQSDICLGIFGNTDKTQRVIPNKVYEYAAMGKVIISADTQAMREIFHMNSDIVGVRSGDYIALAQAIRLLAKDYRQRRDLGSSARNTILPLCSVENVRKSLLTLNDTLKLRL